VQQRVLAAREATRAWWLNAGLPNAALRTHWTPATVAYPIADPVYRSGRARCVHPGLRVTRTIADLAGEEQVGALRLFRGQYWAAYEGR